MKSKIDVDSLKQRAPEVAGVSGSVIHAIAMQVLGQRLKKVSDILNAGMPRYRPYNMPRKKSGG